MKNQTQNQLKEDIKQINQSGKTFSMYHQNICGLDAHYEGLCEILDSH